MVALLGVGATECEGLDLAVRLLLLAEPRGHTQTAGQQEEEEEEQEEQQQEGALG